MAPAIATADNRRVEIFDANRIAWDEAAGRDNPYARPVSSEQVAAARAGDWSIYLSDNRPVPASWFPELAGADVLCLASGGGQQGPIMAATGARVSGAGRLGRAARPGPDGG